MMIVVLIAGVGVLLAGLLAIVFGIPIKEFGFGNTLIVTGVVGACTGMMMVVLWVMVRELKNIARGLAQERSVEARPGHMPGAGEGVDDTDFLFGPEPDVANAGGATSHGQSPEWQEEPVSRGRSRHDIPAEPEPEQAATPRRNLMFSSSRRDRAAARAAEPSMGGLDPAPPVAPAAEPAEAPRSAYEDAAPQSGRSRSAEGPRRSGRPPSAPAEARTGGGTDRQARASQTEEQPQVTVLKSGVVDGMAYSLYSDGSIEAQMPEGMMRFSSVDELRAHLDQRP
jgi:hypothetical protein